MPTLPRPGMTRIVCACLTRSHTLWMMWKWIGTARIERQVKPVFQDGSQFITVLLYLHTCSARMEFGLAQSKKITNKTLRVEFHEMWAHDDSMAALVIVLPLLTSEW
jgi:hypothetical protein